MADATSALQEALLDLGLEDNIPIWEAIGAPEVVAFSNPATVQADVASALSELGETGRVVFYFNPWSDAVPTQIPTAQALSLLGDPRWFDPSTEVDGMRLYFENAENLPGG